jgi:hypothetical protein
MPVMGYRFAPPILRAASRMRSGIVLHPANLVYDLFTFGGI